MRRLLFFTLYIFIVSTSNIWAQVIGKAWEFNESGNSEGWEANTSLSELVIEDGMLKTSVTGRLAAINGPDVNLEAEDYGFVLIRMKADAIGTGKIYWKTESHNSKRMTFQIQPDRLFHEYEIPVHTNSYWVGTVLKMVKLSFDVPSGTQIFIDYIRIITVGPRFDVDFKTFRSVLKVNQKIPFAAIITNSGDKKFVGFSVDFELPANWIMEDGYISQQYGPLEPFELDTIIWTVKSAHSGEFFPRIRLSADSVETYEKKYPASIVDKYWVQKEFAVSAWSPPAQTDDAYNEYAAANFDLIAYCNPQISIVEFIAQHNMQCMLNIGSYITGDFRAADNRPVAPITENDLINVDPIIHTFLNYPASIGYHICDEPNAYAFPNLEKIVSYLRDRDPDRVAYINLFPTYANQTQLGTQTYEEYVRRFVETVKPELISYDHYNFFVENRDGIDYFQNLQIIRKYSVLYDIPFWNIIQAINSQVRTDVWRKISVGEYRWLVYSSLAYGARGIFYFAWSGSYGIMTSPEKDEAYAAIQLLNSELKKLGPILMKLKSTGVYHLNDLPYGCNNPTEEGLVRSASADVDLLVGELADEMNHAYFVLMNKDYNQNIITKVTLNCFVNNVEFYDLETASWKQATIVQSAEGTTFDFQALPGGGTLFKLGTKTNVNQIISTTSNKTFALSQNYPNPFNSTTTFQYRLTQENWVRLTIHDVIGREVATLVNQKQKTGDYELTWDANSLSSGLYICRIKVGAYTQTQKILLLK